MIKLNNLLSKIKTLLSGIKFKKFDQLTLSFATFIFIFFLVNFMFIYNANQNNPGGDNKNIVNSVQSKGEKKQATPKVINNNAVNINLAQVQVQKLASSAQLISITKLEKAMEDKNYKFAFLDSESHAILLLANGKSKLPNLVAYYPVELGGKLVSKLDNWNIDTTTGLDFKMEPTPPVKRNIPWSNIVFWGLIIVIGISYLRRRRQENSAQYSTDRGTENAKHLTNITEQGKIPSDRFSDVAGIDEAVAEMKELVDFLKEPQRFEKTGAKPPRGAVMTGPPGTGKTLLARAVAGEANVPFFAVTGSDFVEKYVGVGAKRVRELFAKAKKAERAIIFIDEIDAVARKRSNDSSNGSSESDNTLIALLAEMDGFAGTHVIVIAATNRIDVLDPAILRPGRLDRKITVPLPDRRGREMILKVHAEGKPLAEDIDYAVIARRTPGMSGADLANLVNEAALEAARAERDTITGNDFAQAIETVAMGRARVSAVVSEADRALTAWHEAGHTICAHLQSEADDPVAVSIIPRGDAGGVTWMSGSDDLFLSKEKALARIVTAMGGRAGEELHLNGSYTQGAYGDLQSATELALTMATKYGMTELGLMVREYDSYSQEQTTAVVEEILAEALILARRILKEHKPLMELLVKELLDKESLNQQEITAIIRSKQPKFYYSQEIVIKEHVKLKVLRVKTKQSILSDSATAKKKSSAVKPKVTSKSSKTTTRKNVSNPQLAGQNAIKKISPVKKSETDSATKKKSTPKKPPKIKPKLK